MNGWLIFWQGVIGITLTAFALLAVIVSIAGWRDLKAMLRKESEKR